jgi:Na+-translocating ferredoxin:NAD+ oxidoreductase RnfD subunit
MSEATDVAPPRGLARLRAIHPKYWVSLLITLILVVGEWQYSILGGYDRLVAALGACVLAELLLARTVAGAPPSIQSAYISGISLSLLVKPQGSLLWPFVLGGLISIGSKFVLRSRGRHLWNPSNFGICVLLLVAPAQVSILSHQWGNDLRTNTVIWFVGLLVASRARVLHVTFAYVLSFVALAWLRSVVVDVPFQAEVAPLTGPMYQLFVFFMITDPRTTVSSRRGRILVAVPVAVLETAIRVAADAHVSALSLLYPAPPIFALFLLGPVAMWIDRRRLASAA